MVYLIETKQNINLFELGDVVLEALEDLNKDRKTDFKRVEGSCWSTPLKSTEDYDEYNIATFEYGFNKDSGFLRTSDSILAYKIKSLKGIFDKDFALSLIWGGIKPSWVLIPGLAETCPVDKKGMFYMNPTNEGKFNAYLVGKAIKGVEGVEKVFYCSTDGEGKPELISIQISEKESS